MRGLRFVSQLDLDPDAATLRADARRGARRVSLVSGERIGGGLAADGLGELSKLLLGAQPAKALRLARDTGVLVHLLPELEPAIGFEQESRYHALTVDEHTFAVVQAAADAGMPLRVRLAALFHDARQAAGRLARDGRPAALLREARLLRPRATSRSAPSSPTRRSTGCATRPTCASAWCASCAAHMFDPGKGDPLRARKLLARLGDEPRASTCSTTRRPTCAARATARGRTSSTGSRAFASCSSASRASPHRLRDLAVDGDDLSRSAIGPGPEIGRTLQTLLQRGRRRAVR